MRRLAAALTVTLLATGCAGPGRVEPGGEPAAAYPPTELVLRVSLIGGFTTPMVILGRPPVISVYGDGTVITEGPQTLQYPPPVVPSVEIRRITPAGATRLAQLALDAGVGSATDYGTPTITDHPSTRFVVSSSSGLKTLEVYALSDPEDSGLSAAQKSARGKLRALLEDLADLPGTLGADAGGPAEVYQPAAVAVVSTKWAPFGEQPEQPEATWPGPALPGEVRVVDTGCLIVKGDQVRPVLDAVRGAHGATPWRSGAERWVVSVRPLMPDESTCDDLGK